MVLVFCTFFGTRPDTVAAAFEHKGCCSQHQGVCACKDGHAICGEGHPSPTCSYD
jgi:hypothetical protein